MSDSTAIQAATRAAVLQPDQRVGELQLGLEVGAEQPGSTVQDVGSELLRAIEELEDAGLRRVALPLMKELIDEGFYQLSDVVHGGKPALKLSCVLGEFLIDADTLHVTNPRLMRVL